MKKCFTLTFFLFFISQLVISQQITLNWQNPSPYYDATYSNLSFPFFSNEGYNLEGDLPVFIYSELDVNYTQAQLSNLVWEEVSLDALADTSLQSIPKQEEAFAKIVKSRQQPNLLVRVVPFKWENQNLYRLKSFSINTSQDPVNQAFGFISDFGDSVLKEGVYHKISVDTTGVFKIDYQFLNDNGITTGGLNPNLIKIYGNGGAMMSETIDDFVYYDLQENAIEVVGAEDGSFDENDYILFYAQGPHSVKRNVLNQPLHITNLYEDKAYYFIRVDGHPGLRVTSAESDPTNNYITEFDDYRVVEPERYNVNEVGRVWVGENFTLENTQSYSFDNLIGISNSVPVRCQLSLYTHLADGHTVNVNLNGNSVINSAVFTNQEYHNVTFLGNTQMTGTNLNIEITVDNAANPIGTSWFDYIELFFKQSLNYNGSQFNFRRLDNINNGNPYGFRMSQAGNARIWDVSQWTQPKELISHGAANQFDFTYQSTDPDFSNEFVAFTETAAYSPEYIGTIKNQNLRGLSQKDYLIITDKAFVGAAQTLAQFHEDQGLNTAIATTDQIYNEFSSGSQDLAAIRNFTRFLYKKDGQLRYLALLGDASYDFKDRISNNSNLIPSYQSWNSLNLIASYVTDDFFGILDDGELGLNSSQLDLAIGRMPASNVQEAQTLVEKSLRYANSYPEQSSPFGIWRTKTKILVDDDNPNDAFHTSVENNVSQYIESTEPQLNVRKLYLDAFEQVVTAGGERYPDVNEELDNSVESGALFINYFGHGGPRGWAQERVITESQILSYQNLNSVFTRLPLFTTVTCDFSVWDNPNLDSAGEYLAKTAQGGSIASITTSRAIGVGYGQIFNTRLVQNLFAEVGNKFKNFGDALTDAKISYPAGDNWKTNLLGDPALSLYRPPRTIELTTINGEDAATFNGVLRALDFIEISGVVLDEPALQTDTEFNGKAEIEIYDKKEQKSTRNNDGNLGVMDYEEQVTRIYSGSTQVVNGAFSFGFYIPKDINYTIGNGKLIIYAENNITDGLYYKDDILIGDINPEGLNDDEPPVARLYMNNRHFANGGITNKDPIFIACVTDSTGINSTGVGIGHDITMVLDGNLNQTKVLNSFYQGGEQTDCPNPNLLDYQKGMVSYNLKNIEEGEHQITFKVWDINNNSTTETLDFIVVQEGEVGLVINRLLNWPNPFTDKTYFHFEHNCDEILEVQIQIFTISGKLVKTIRQQVTSEPYRKGYRTDKFGIPWDGLDDYGDKIGKGTYIFKATVKGSNSASCKGTASALEKLVILK